MNIFSIKSLIQILSLPFVFALSVSAYTCLNTGPDSHCASPEAPGGLQTNETPQFIVITFDDALHQPAFDYTEKLLGYGHQNPNGAPIPATYFISTEYTDFHIVQRRYAQGCEIGVHTMSHTTSTNTDYDTWLAEITGCKQTISDLANIPLDEIVGFRAPFLQYNDASFNVLSDNGFLYESSITEKFGGLSADGSSYIWPYTLDNLGAQSHDVGTAPEREYPGFWEIPMWTYYTNGVQMNSMDYPGGYSELLSMFKNNFDLRYAGNRAPIGVFLHPGWLSEDSHADALNDFLTWALAKEGVWVVTNHQLIQWMKDPQTINGMNQFAPVQYTPPASGVEVADGWDNNGNGEIDEGFMHSCNYGSYNFNTNSDCPEEYPEPVVVPTKIITATRNGDDQVVDNCTESDWVNSLVYNQDDLVTYNGHTWRAKWYTKGNIPGSSEWGPWEDKGACSYTQTTYHGKITPSGSVHVVANGNKTFSIEPDAGYMISDVKVDGQTVGAVSSYTFTNVIANHSIEVDFVLDDGTVYHSIAASAGSNGTISPEGNVSVIENGSKTFSITPDNGYRILSVTVDGINKGAIESYEFASVTENHTINAEFEFIPVSTYSITAVSQTNGTISPSGVTTVNEGANQAYSITADAGYQIDSVVVDGDNKGAVSSYTFNAVSADHSINAYFSELTVVQYSIIINITGDGVASHASPVTVNEGENVTLSFTPNSGNKIESVTVDGSNQGSINSFTFSSLNANHVVDVVFVPNTGSQCDGVEAWNANQNWTEYSAGDLRVNGGKLWECINIAYSIYEPSGPWGYFGWSEVAVCE